MQGTTLRRLAALGLALAFVGVLVPGFHHVRCSRTLSVDGGPQEPMTCVKTFPHAVAEAAGIVGIAGALLALGAGLALHARSDILGPRALLALAAIALAVPALIILAGWASAGSDLALREQDGACHSGSGAGTMPLWLQTPTCLDGYDVLRVPLLALAGIAAGLGATRLQPRVMLLGVIAAGIAVLTIVAAIVLDATVVGLVWILPALGAVLLAAGAWLARRAQPEVAPA